MTAKELYDWTVANNCETLPLVTGYISKYDEYTGDGFITPNSIEVGIDPYEGEKEIKGLILTAENDNYMFE